MPIAATMWFSCASMSATIAATSAALQRVEPQSPPSVMISVTVRTAMPACASSCALAITVPSSDDRLIVERRAEARIVVRGRHPLRVLERGVREQHVAVEVARVREHLAGLLRARERVEHEVVAVAHGVGVVRRAAIDCESSGIIVTSTTSLAATSSIVTPRPAWICAPTSTTSSVGERLRARARRCACASSSSFLTFLSSSLLMAISAGCPASWRSDPWT